LVLKFVDLLFEVLIWLIIIRCLLSFINLDPYHPIVRFIYDVTEPIMGPFRRIIPNIGMFDFSPLVAVLAVEVARQLVIKLILLLF
jgi:YggT family protein